MGEQIRIDATDGSGSMVAYLTAPDGEARAGIVVIQEILGVNPGIRAMADSWAAEGYLAIAPDLYWRMKPGVELDADVPEQFQQGLDYLQAFDVDKSIEDLQASIDALRVRGCEEVGVVGYCLGGRLAFLCATRTDSDASVAYYGVGIHELLGEKSRITKPLLVHIATRDRFVPAEAQARIRAELADKANVTIYDYDSDHAFARHSGSSRVPALADLADGRTKAFFADMAARSHVPAA